MFNVNNSSVLPEIHDLDFSNTYTINYNQSGNIRTKQTLSFLIALLNKFSSQFTGLALTH